MTNRLLVAVGFVLVFCIGTASATTPGLRVRALAAPGGATVAASGDTVVVGMPFTVQDGRDRGAIDIFTHSAGRWTLAQQFTPTLERYRELGVSLAFSGDTIAATEEHPEHVVIFTRSDGTWAQTQSLMPTSKDTGFGTSIAIDGPLMVVGARKGGPTPHGAVEVYQLVGDTWTFVQELTPNADARKGFGDAVGTNGTQIVVGAVQRDSETGRVYTYTQVGGVWVEQQRLAPPDAQVDEAFGGALAVSGRTLVVGAQRHQVAGAGSTGAAYVYRLGGGGSRWSLATTLAPPASDTNTHYGARVATDGASVLVGSPGPATGGAAFLYTHTGGAWSQAGELDSPAPGDPDFGYAVAVEPHLAVVGGYPAQEVTTYAGRIIR